MDPKFGRLALKAAIIYVVVAVTWDFSSDFLLERIKDPAGHFIFLDQLKDSIFAVFTGGLMYWLLRRSLLNWERENQAHIRALAEKKEQVKIFRELFLVVPDAVFMVDVESLQILDANPAAEKMYGYTREELLQKKGSDLSAEPEETRRVIATHQKVVPLRWHRRKNGEVFAIEATTNFFEYHGREVHVAVMRDITERTKVESALQESEARYRRLFEFESDAIVVLDRDTLGIVDVNQSAIKLYGYSREEFLKLKAPDISAEPELTREVIQQDHKVSPVKWHRRKNGERFPIEIYGSNFEINGRRMKMGAMRDISARHEIEQALKQSEEKYRSLFEHMNEGVAYCQMIFEDGKAVDFVYLAVNDMFTSLTGLKDVTGKRVTEVIPSLRTDDPELLEIYGRVAATGVPEKHERYVSALQSWFGLSICSPGKDLVVVIFDVISRRKQMEESLRESEEKFRQLVENIEDVFWITSADMHTVHFVSPGCERLWGHSVASMYANPNLWAEAIHPEERERVFSAFVALAGSQTEVDIEYRIIRPDGTVRWVHDRGFQVLDAAGKVIRMAGIASDITERKLVEEKLRLQSGLINSLLDSIPDLVFYKDLNGGYLGCNPALAEFVGKSRDAIIGRTDHELFDRATADFFREQDAKMLATMEPRQNEEWVTYPDGRKVLLHTLKTPYRGPDGQVIGVLGISRDISARHLMEQALREREEQLVLFVEHSPAAIAMLNNEMRYVVASRRWVEDFRLGKKPLTGRSHYEVFPEVPDRWKEIHRRCLEGAVEKCDEEEFRRADGTSDWIRWEIRPWRHADGGIGGVIIFSEDITTRKKAEAMVRASEEFKQYVLDSVPSHIAVLDGNGVIIATNARWKDFARENAAARDTAPLARCDIGVNYLEVCRRSAAGSEDARRVLEGIATVKDHKSSNFTLEYSCDSPTQLRWFLMTVTSLGKEGGSVVVSHNDITARRQAEIALRDNQQLLRTVIDLVPHFVFAKDINSRHLLVNKTCAAANGLTPEQMVGKTDLELLMDPKNAEAFMRDDQEVIRSGRQKFIAEERMTDVNGKTRILQTVKTPFTLPGQSTAGLVGVAVDITAQTEADEALRRSEERFRLLWQQSADGIRLTDAAGKVVMANAAYCQMMELPPEAVGGHAMCDVYLAENREKILNDHRVKFAARSVAARVETEVTLWNGKKLWLEVSNSFLEHPGTEPLLLAMFRDVTKRRQADEQMRLQSSTLTAAANSIFIVNVRGVIEWVNPAFCELTGYTPAEVIGQNPRLLKSGEQPREFYTKLWKTIMAGNVWHGELINRRKDGSCYHEYMTITPVKNDAGKVTHFVSIKQDITERKQLSARLQQAEKMEAIGTLAGGIAHDFNNILAAMFGYGYLLQSDCEGNASAAENITEILKAATRAKDLVQQILTFSRQREQKRQVVRLNTVIKEAMKFMRASLPAGIRIDMELQDDSMPVFADPSQIYQVVLNLATNAFHAMEGSRGTLTVSLREFVVDDLFRREHPEITTGSCMQLVIADTGHGMKPEVLAHLFEPFFTTKPVGKGTGLGLAVVHGIVKSHDAAIEVESRVGQGTSFRIYFPARPGEDITAAAESHQLPRGQGQHILVVDDEVAITGVFQKLLTRLNYRITTANSPVTALETFRGSPDAFALVITDRTMPDMDGFELATRIHELNPQVPVVLASGQTTELTEAHMAQAGIISVIEKPVVNATLAKLIAQFLADHPA